MLVEMGIISVWRISMKMISTHTTSTSIFVRIRVYLNIKSPNYVNTSQRGKSSYTSTQKALMYSATTKRQHSTLDQGSRKLTVEETLTPTTHQVDACSWKLTGEENSESTTYMNVCPEKVIRELMKPIKMNTAPLEFIGDIMTQV